MDETKNNIRKSYNEEMIKGRKQNIIERKIEREGEENIGILHNE